jgi:hypothetical protein
MGILGNCDFEPFFEILFCHRANESLRVLFFPLLAQPLFPLLFRQRELLLHSFSGRQQTSKLQDCDSQYYQVTCKILLVKIPISQVGQLLMAMAKSVCRTCIYRQNSFASGETFVFLFLILVRSFLLLRNRTKNNNSLPILERHRLCCSNQKNMCSSPLQQDFTKLI